MKKQIGISMTEGAPWRHTVRFAIPVFAGALLQQLYSTVDMMIVGRFTGEKALSAVGTTGSFVFLLLTVAQNYSGKIARLTDSECVSCTRAEKL